MPITASSFPSSLPITAGQLNQNMYTYDGSYFAAQGVLPKLYTTTVLAGEKSGNLEEVLTRYIQFQRLALTFRKKLSAALVYPTLLVVLITAMMFFMFTFVIPKFGELYEQISAEKSLEETASRARA